LHIPRRSSPRRAQKPVVRLRGAS